MPPNLETITIGVGAPLSGASAQVGREMANAIELAVGDADSGILRGHLATRIEDDRGRVETGSAIAKAFCDQSDVVAVVGHYNSDVTIAAAHRYHACALPLIAPIASNPRVTEQGYANVFRFTNRDDRTAEAIAGFIVRERGKRRAAVVRTESAYGASMADAFARAFLMYGGDVVAQATIREGERDFDALVAALPKRTEVVFYGGSFEGAFILRAMRVPGLDQLFAAGDGCWDKTGFLEPAGSAATIGEGVLVLSATPGIGRVEGSQSFADRYARSFGPIGNYAVNAFDATRLMLSAIEQAIHTCGAPARTDIVAAVRNIRYRGIAYSDIVQWDAKGDNTAAITALNVVENGRFRQIAEIDRTGRCVYATESMPA